MIHNALFRECLAEIPQEQRAEFELSFTIAERIADLLKRKGMTQRELAQKLGKRESEVSKWLSGRHNFTTNTLARISLALDAPIIKVATSTYSIPDDQTMCVAEDLIVYGKKSE